MCKGSRTRGRKTVGAIEEDKWKEKQRRKRNKNTEEVIVKHLISEFRRVFSLDKSK